MDGSGTVEPHPKWRRLWAAWVCIPLVVSMLASGLGHSLQWGLFLGLGQTVPALLVAYAANGGTTGIAAGVSEWLVLRSRLDVSLWWIAATAVAGLFTPAFSRFMNTTALAAVHTAAGASPGLLLGGLVALVVVAAVATGAVVGTLQWLVLRSRLRRAGWWIPAWIAGAGLGAFVIVPLELVVPRSESLAGEVLHAGLSAVVARGVTGLALVRLLKSQRQRGAMDTPR